MSVWKSDEKLLILVLLKWFCSRSNIKHSTQCFITRWNTSKFVKIRDSAARLIFSSLLGVSSGDQTLRLILDILQQNVIHHWLRRQIVKNIPLISSLIWIRFVVVSSIGSTILANLLSWTRRQVLFRPINIPTAHESCENSRQLVLGF